MRKYLVIISIIIYAVFSYFFVHNLIQELDLFYIMWGAILFPVVIVFLLPIKTDHEIISFFIFFAHFVLLLLVMLLQWQHQSIPTEGFLQRYPDLYLTILLSYLFIVTTLLSYVITIAHFRQFSMQQFVLYSLMILLFILCRIVFDKYRIAEYVFALLLYIIMTMNYISIQISTLKKHT